MSPNADRRWKNCDEICAALNKRGILPWSTDAKHYLDRYRLLIASFTKEYSAITSAFWTKEFCERDQLLSDIVTAADDVNERERDRVSILEMAKTDKDLLKSGKNNKGQGDG
jgi:hypothetical protein